MKRIVAVNSNCYHGFTVEEAIDGIHAAGFHYIELTATKGWTEHVFPNMSFEYLNSVKEKLKKADLIPFAMSGHCNLMDRDRIEDFIANMRLASFFSCKFIVSSIGEAHLKDNTVISNKEVAQHIRELIPHLVEFDLNLVLENHGEHSTGKIIKEIVDTVSSPRVLINYDTANIIHYAGIDPLEDIPGCVDKIGYMHIKDKIGGKGEWDFPALGKGHVDFKEIFKMLDDARNACPVSIEIEFTQKGPKNVAEVNEAVSESCAYLKSLGIEF